MSTCDSIETQGCDSIETQVCAKKSCRKVRPKDAFQNRYGKKFEWCINCREERVAGHNRRTREELTKKTAAKARWRARNAAASSSPQTPRTGSSPPPTPSTLANLRRCKRCQKNLPADAFDTEFAQTSQWCIPCWRESKAGGPRSSNDARSRPRGRARSPLYLPQRTPEEERIARVSGLRALTPRTSSVSKAGDGSRERSKSLDLRPATTSSSVTPTPQRHTSPTGTVHELQHPTGTARGKMSGPVREAQPRSEKSSLTASKATETEQFERSDDADDEIMQEACGLLKVMDGVDGDDDVKAQRMGRE